jgi:hypothetical protein
MYRIEFHSVIDQLVIDHAAEHRNLACARFGYLRNALSMSFSQFKLSPLRTGYDIISPEVHVPIAQNLAFLIARVPMPHVARASDTIGYHDC